MADTAEPARTATAYQALMAMAPHVRALNDVLAWGIREGENMLAWLRSPDATTAVLPFVPEGTDRNAVRLALAHAADHLGQYGRWLPEPDASSTTVERRALVDVVADALATYDYPSGPDEVERPLRLDQARAVLAAIHDHTREGTTP